MQTLHILVRNLVMILLLATFLELLLPNKSMRGFVQMVMGLFVISAILSPVTIFLRTPLEMAVPAWTATSPQDLPAIAAEGQGRELAHNAVQEQYRQILVNQVRAIVIGSKGVEGAEVVVEFEEGTGGLTDQPKITLIRVTLTAVQEKITPVEPVLIGESSPAPTEKPSPRADRIRDRIAELMCIEKEKITIPLLGWGEQTFSRNFDGDMPTKQYSEILKQIYPTLLIAFPCSKEVGINLKSDKAYKKAKPRRKCS